MPYPFQIFQTPDFVAITYEYVHASRTIHMSKQEHLPDIDFWMGDSRGKWVGNTLVVDVADNEASHGWMHRVTSTMKGCMLSSATPKPHRTR